MSQAVNLNGHEIHGMDTWFVRAGSRGMGNCIILFYVNLMTYLFIKRNAGSANLRF